MNPDDDAPVSEIMLERYRLKELPAHTMAYLEQRLEQDERLRRRLDALGESDYEICSSNNLAAIETHVRRTLAARTATAERRQWPSIPRWAVPAVVATVVMLLLVFPRMTSLPAEDDERIKGLQPTLVLYRRVGSGSEMLADGAVVHEGDVIRVGYRAAGRAYGVILSIDGRGHVTLHLPTDGDRAVQLSRDTTVLLDQAYELDDAPRFERFYFVIGREPFLIAPIVASVQRAAGSDRRHPAATLTLSAGLEQSVFSLQKESQP